MAKTDIKTKAKQTIKTIETVGIITEKVKDAGIKTKDDIGKAINIDADTPEQYASQRFQGTTHSAATDTAYYFNKAGKKSVVETKKNVENAKVTIEEIKARRAERKAKSKSAEQTTDPANPMEIATIDDSKKSILSNIFWDMNSIDSKVEKKTETKETTTTDEYGNEIITTDEITTKVLTISISSKTADEMANAYSFNDKQKQYLAELMNESNDKLWASIIFSTGSNSNVDIDIGSLDFCDETVNDTQRKIVAVATNSSSYGISSKSGYCQAWVADVYQAVTGSRGSAHCALCAADSWAVSNDWSKIQVGATVYGYASNPFGHVGIYIGNGMVAHNIGYIKIEPIDDWIKKYKGFAWGWENNIKIN